MLKSFLLVGQSNMAGRGLLNEVSPIVNERIQMLRNGRWQMMMEPIHFDRVVAGVGPAASFAEALCQQDNQIKIGLIPCAEGGSSIEEWHKEDSLFRHALSESKFAIETSQLEAILWHQGESNAVEGKYDNYYNQLSHIVSTLREELHAKEAPFIIGGLGDFLGKKGYGKYCTKHEEINSELMRFAAQQDNVYFVTAKGLSANEDGIHFDAKSQRILGIRYFEAYSKRVSIVEPLENEAELCQQLESRPHTALEKMTFLNMELARGNMSYETYEQNLEQLMSK